MVLGTDERQEFVNLITNLGDGIDKYSVANGYIKSAVLSDLYIAIGFWVYVLLCSFILFVLSWVASSNNGVNYDKDNHFNGTVALICVNIIAVIAFVVVPVWDYLEYTISPEAAIQSCLALIK